MAFYSEKSLDDLLHVVLLAILNDGVAIKPTRGDARELAGVLLELQDTRCRLSRSEARGCAFSCLGELCWYLSASNSIEFISHYVPNYDSFVTVTNGVVKRAYGPRLLNWEGINQVRNVIVRLRNNSVSRKAVIQILDKTDLDPRKTDVPCTCTLQFLVRGDRLNLLVMMRSNDVIIGLPHDIFCFTMIQELVARSLAIEVGWYRHAVGSLHLYEDNRASADAFLSEGWQSSQPMPSMPAGDPWESLKAFRSAEALIRTKGKLPKESLDALGPYWGDLIRLLLVHSAAKREDLAKVASVQQTMCSEAYRVYIDDKMAALKTKTQTS